MIMSDTLVISLIADHHHTTSKDFVGNMYGDTIIEGYGWRVVNHVSADASLAEFITRSNLSSPDFAVFNGDLFQSSSSAADFIASAQNFVSDMAGLVAPFYCTLGHHDLSQVVGHPADAAAFVRFFDDTEGIGTLITTGTYAPKNRWWHTAVADETPAAYVVDKKDCKVIFLANTFSAGANSLTNMESTGESDEGGGVAEITQLDWLKLRLAEAESAGLQVIIITHFGFYNSYPDITGPGGYEDTITELEAQTISPIVIQGHVHADSEIGVVNGVTYYSQRGDTWSYDPNDSNRYSHSIIEITAGAVWGGTAKKANIKITGYGNAATKTEFDGYAEATKAFDSYAVL